MFTIASTAPTALADTNEITSSKVLIPSPEAWSEWMNGALVSRSEGGLRVEVAPGKNWAIAAFPQADLPPVVSMIRVRIQRVTGGAHWLVRLHGDLRGKGVASDYGPFQGETAKGTQTLELDPRLLSLENHPPIQVQVGVEGPPGA